MNQFKLKEKTVHTVGPLMTPTVMMTLWNLMMNILEKKQYDNPVLNGLIYY
jgi:hypothetical protein